MARDSADGADDSCAREARSPIDAARTQPMTQTVTMMRAATPTIFLGPGRAGKGMLRSDVVDNLVDDVVRGVGYGVLKLVTLGRYRSGGNGLFLEGCVGLLLLATGFFVLQKFVA